MSKILIGLMVDGWHVPFVDPPLLMDGLTFPEAFIIPVPGIAALILAVLLLFLIVLRLFWW